MLDDPLGDIHPQARPGLAHDGLTFSAPQQVRAHEGLAFPTQAVVLARNEHTLLTQALDGRLARVELPTDEEGQQDKREDGRDHALGAHGFQSSHRRRPYHANAW